MISLLSGTQDTAAALQAEKVRMEVVAQNIANANTTKGPNGQPYQRQRVVFETVLKQQLDGTMRQQLDVSRIESDNRPSRMIHNPGHPDADEHGMVAYPDINIHEEMVDLIAASRAFEANLAVARNAKQLAIQTMSIGKK